MASKFKGFLQQTKEIAFRQVNFELLVIKRAQMPWTNDFFRPSLYWGVCSAIAGFVWQWREGYVWRKYVIYRNTSEYDLPPIKEADWLWHNRQQHFLFPVFMLFIGAWCGASWTRCLARHDETLIRNLKWLSAERIKSGVLLGMQVYGRCLRSTLFLLLAYNTAKWVENDYEILLSNGERDLVIRKNWLEVLLGTGAEWLAMVIFSATFFGPTWALYGWYWAAFNRPAFRTVLKLIQKGRHWWPT